VAKKRSSKRKALSNEKIRRLNAQYDRAEIVPEPEPTPRPEAQAFLRAVEQSLVDGEGLAFPDFDSEAAQEVIEGLVMRLWANALVANARLKVERGKRRKGKGVVARDVKIAELVAQGLSDGQIMIHQEIIAANGGRTMNRAAVAKVRRTKAGVTKKKA
jgi:hypothetical protein